MVVFMKRQGMPLWYEGSQGKEDGDISLHWSQPTTLFAMY